MIKRLSLFYGEEYFIDKPNAESFFFYYNIVKFT